MKPYRWKTIWTGNATTGNTISTGINFNNIKRIRFKDNRSNCWHEANIDSFLNGNEITWGTIYNHFEAGLTRFYDFCLKMDNKTSGSIFIGRCGYVFEYATDNKLVFNNASNGKIEAIEVIYK
nr:MAG TPA: hypothetical protein [Caudoviricetes sp.]